MDRMLDGIKDRGVVCDAAEFADGENAILNRSTCGRQTANANKY